MAQNHMNKLSLLLGSLVLCTSTLFAANPAGVGPEAARESVNKFIVANGLEVTLFASEPMVRNPTDMDIDARGRVWIAEGVNYRSTFQRWGILQPGGDRIVILEDTNGDGVADKETVFYQDPSINAALGVCVLGGRVIVSSSPHVFALTDTDGDSKADKRELLFTGLSGKDHDHGVHAFVFGPDGKLYFNMGNEGKQLYYPVNKDIPLHGAIDKVEMKPVVDLAGNEINNHGKPYRMGMVFRCNLDGSGVETLGWNFRNNYEVAVDSFGTLWQSDNDDDGNRGVRINYVMEFGNFGYADEMTGAGWPAAWNKAKAKGATEDEKIYYEWHQYDPGVVPNLLHTGAGSPTGILVYEGKLLPDVFRNQIIHCDAGPRIVRAYPAQPDGAGFKASTVDMVSSPESDKWFRPSDVCVAPDGTVYIADWNDAGVGGHNMEDRKLDAMTGRVYRVAPKGSKPPAPKLDLATAAGCVAALQSPNQATRYAAWTKLRQMQGQAEKELTALWNGDDARMRARALHLLARIKGNERKYVEQAINDSNPDIRITGLRIARELKLDVISYVKTLAGDRSAQVRREAAIALHHNPAPEAPKLWAQLAAQHDDKDRWYLEALGIGADNQWDKFLDAWLAEAGDKWNTPAGRDIVWRSRGRKTPSMLVKLINDKGLGAKERDHYFRSLDFLNGPEKDAAMAELAVGGLK
jgi:putative membrane-bound dehydrogenase-like protein